MSGICGVCEIGAAIGRESAAAMRASLVLPGELEPQVVAGRSFAFGVARRWPGQELASVPGVHIAANTDLVDTSELKALVSRHGVDSAELRNTELIAWAYKFAGMEFLKFLSGAFALALWNEENQTLTLVVDRFGINSLYWSVVGERILFASAGGHCENVRNHAGR